MGQAAGEKKSENGELNPFSQASRMKLEWTGVVFMGSNPYIEITPGIVGGKPRVAGHRIAVQNIAIWHEWMGKSVDEIADEYDLTLAEVYAALAYYFAHREEIDKSIEEGLAFVGAMRNATRSKLKAKLQEQRE
jgi:uncharacterized protein (DUF433 family)